MDDPQIDIMKPVHEQNHQGCNHGEKITDPEIHQEKGIQEVKENEAEQQFLFRTPL